MGSEQVEPNTSAHSSENSEDIDVPPDGGRRAWLVLMASFICNGFVFAIVNSFGVIYIELNSQLQRQGIESHDSQAALPGSLAAGMTYMLSALAGVLSVLLGLRTTAVIGGSIIVFSLLLSSFVVNHINALCLTHGVIFGLGGALAYTPAIAILGHYFKKYLGLANGFVTLGESFITVLLPFLMEYTISFGLQWMFRVLAILTVSIAIGGLVYKPMPSMELRLTADSGKSYKSIIKAALNCDIFKNMTYKIWSVSIALGLVGHYIPFVYLPKFVETTFPDMGEIYTNLPVQCLAATSMVGRFFFGYISDFPTVDAIQLQQIALFMLGILNLMVPFARIYGILIAIASIMGIFEGAIIVLTGPVATQICGVAEAPHGIGFMFALTSLPVSFCPPLAGYMFHITQTYVLSFVFAALWLLLGGFLLFAIRFPCSKCCGRNKSRNLNTDGKKVITPTDSIEKGTEGNLVLPRNDSSKVNNLKKVVIIENNKK